MSARVRPASATAARMACTLSATGSIISLRPISDMPIPVTATFSSNLSALAIVGTEYVLRWLPRGTHQWDKFVTPNELEIAIEKAGCRISDETGVIYNLLADRWQLSSDMDVNYMVVAEKAA